MLNQEAYQRTMALPVGGNDLAAQNQAVFCIVDFELCRAAKVLEHLAVFIRNCDFHKGPPVCFIVCQNNCRSGWQRMSFSSFF